MSIHPNMSFELKKLSLPDVHIVNGQEFPVAFELVSEDSNPSPEKVKAFLKEEGKTGFFKEQVQLHGAVVIRGLGSTVPQDISDFIQTIAESGSEVPLVQVGAFAERTKLTKVLTTANEGDLTLYIDQHNEFSRFLRYPTTLYFSAQKFNGEGGETPITHGGELFQELYKEDPEEVTKLGRDGLLMNQTWQFKTPNNTSWQDYFAFGRTIDKERDSLETKKEKAAKLVEEYVSHDWKWDADNNLLVGQHTKPIREFTRPDGAKYPTWFNSIAAYYTELRGNDSIIDTYKKTSDMVYDNKKPINKDFLERILQTSRRLAYLHTWKEGDLAIVDNRQVSHGRAGLKSGERVILVSMWEGSKFEDYPAWEGVKA